MAGSIVGPFALRSFVSGWLLIALSLASLGFGPPQLTDADQPQAPVYGYQLGLMAADVPPTLSARAAVIMDRTTGKMVYGRQAHLRVAPASTTKIMTAIVALEKGRLTDRVVVKAEYLRPLEGTGSSLLGLAPGDELTLEDLLWGMLLPSGNDAALVVANHVGGTVDNFVQMMNDKARELDLKDTHFVNPHGLDADGHYSTAYDLAVMGRYALNNPTFARIVATESKTLQASRTFYLVNTNRLLARPDVYPGVDGIKTGTTDNAGDCIVTSVTRDGHPVIAVIMGSQSRVPDAASLIDYAYSRFEWLSLPLPAFPTLVDSQGTPHPVTLQSRQEMIPHWERFRVHLSIRLDRAADASSPGKGIGTAVYRIGDQTLEVPVQMSSP